MNKSRQIPFKLLILLLCFIATGAYGQKQTKVLKENFNVSEDAVLDIDTSHADIEFETWGKNEIAIEATIEIEDASNEEAEKYFDNSGLEIFGNSKKVSISTESKNTWLWPHAVEIPELNNYSFDFNFDFDELANISIPPMVEFDHKAFKEDGEKYLRDWKKKFDESYDEEHVRKLEEWAKRMVEKQGKIEKKRAEMMEKRAKILEKRVRKLAERHGEMAKVQAQAKKMEAQILKRRTRRGSGNDSTSIFFFDSNEGGKPSIFYGNSDGSHKNYKVKKTIKVKMPKGMKIKMNVRHGEVKLAGNTMNLNAILSHSSLWATGIDGVGTKIDASYTPVNVKTWYNGQLQTKYSENVALEEVFDLKLNSTSSNVMIDHIVNGVFIKNDFGPLDIKSISNNFKDIDIALQNAELNCKVPNVPFTIYVNGTSSRFAAPAHITLDQTKNHSTTVHKGYFKNKNAGSSIVINAKYSEVTLE